MTRPKPDVTNDGWRMPDGSGPWTVIAYKESDRTSPGVRGRVEVIDAPLNRSEYYHYRADAEAAANSANRAKRASTKTDGEAFAGEHEGVDWYEVRLRQNAAITVSGDNADGLLEADR